MGAAGVLVGVEVGWMVGTTGVMVGESTGAGVMVGPVTEESVGLAAFVGDAGGGAVGAIVRLQANPIPSASAHAFTIREY